MNKLLTKFLLTAALVISTQAAVSADNVLYAVVDGTNMTLKCGAESKMPDGAVKYNETFSWNADFSNTITSATIDASCAAYTGSSLTSLFDGCSHMTSITGLRNLNTANVTDISYMFYGCTSLTTLNLTSWNTASVTDMRMMFSNCTSLTTIYVGSGWSTAAVEYGTDMFRGSTALVGGDGTTYSESESHVDYTYARVGDGGDNPGYLSRGLKVNLADGRRWATYYNDQHTYVIDIEEKANAYAASYDEPNSRLVLHKIGHTIPKGKAVIIVSDDDYEYIVMEVNDNATATVPENSLNGTNIDITVSDLKGLLLPRYEGATDGTFYVMGMTSKGFGFHKYTGDTVPAHKAFLFVPINSNAPASVLFSFSDAITGIQGIQGADTQEADVWYTINGVRLNGKPSSPGLYIYNGMKISVK